MLEFVKPSGLLSPFVEGFCCVRDMDGAHCGLPIETAPRPGGVLTVNLGRPNSTADGGATPMLSLLGVQTRRRTWRSDVGTHIVMALLTPAGLARLAPGAGASTADTFIDLGAVVGDRAAASLLHDASARPDTATSALDEWLQVRLLGGGGRADARGADAACRVLARSRRVDEAAERLGITRRHLARVLSEHLGVGPKALLGLYRLDRSLRAVQSGTSLAADGFSDQAHQVREWRRRLCTTPGVYTRRGPSELAAVFGADESRTAFYL